MGPYRRQDSLSVDAPNMELSRPAELGLFLRLCKRPAFDQGPGYRGRLQRIVRSDSTPLASITVCRLCHIPLFALEDLPEIPRLNYGNASMPAENEQILVAGDYVLSDRLLCQRKNMIVRSVP